jgi:hypothetical protein
MISYVPGGVDIPVRGITNGSIINNDGHGWAVAAGDTLLVGKSMVFEEALDEFLEARLALGQGAVAMFHSRFGTHGEEGEYNIHPFHFAEDSVMAHNGILPSKFHPNYQDRRSDTRIFVDRHARFVDNPNGVPSRRGAAVLGRRIGLGNKLVFISTRSGSPKVRIVNADQGVQTDGLWYSNTGYLTDYSWYGYTGRRPMDKYDWAETEADRQARAGWSDYMDEACVDDEGKDLVLYTPTPCRQCGSKDLDEEYGMCNACGSCLDCDDNFAYCMCWRPGGMSWNPSAGAMAEAERGSENIPTIG